MGVQHSERPQRSARLPVLRPPSACHRYKGVIAGYDEPTGQHRVIYDDGEQWEVGRAGLLPPAQPGLRLHSLLLCPKLEGVDYTSALTREASLERRLPDMIIHSKSRISAALTRS